MVFSSIPNVTITRTVAENRFSQRHERFLPRENSFKFVTECFFVTQRALHVGLLPAVETFTTTASELGKQIQAKIGEEKLLKDLNAVSEDSHGLVSGQNPGHSASSCLLISLSSLFHTSVFHLSLFKSLLHLTSSSSPQLYILAWTCCILDPQFVQYCSEFYITQAVWLLRQLESCAEVCGDCPSVYVTIATVALYLFTTMSLW